MARALLLQRVMRRIDRLRTPLLNFVTALTVLAAATLACDGAPDPAPGAELPKMATVQADAELEKRIGQMLDQQDALRGVTASVDRGVVRLRGVVPRTRDRDDLEQLVRGIDGVRDVHVDVSVSGSPAGLTTPPVDTDAGR